MATSPAWTWHSFAGTRDTPAPAHTAEEPDTAHLLRLLVQSPIIAERWPTKLTPRLSAARSCWRKSRKSATTRLPPSPACLPRPPRRAAIALDLHRQWAEAERGTRGLAVELFTPRQQAEAATQRLERQLTATAPEIVPAFQRELEDAIERAMAMKAPMPEGGRHSDADGHWPDAGSAARQCPWRL